MSAPTEALTFQFTPDISFAAYRALWQSRLEESKALFAGLERVRADSDIEGYLEELNAYDVASSAGDVRGGIWNEMHPDPAFREEGAAAKKAFIALGSQVDTSAAIAANLATFAQAGHKLEGDSKRFLEEWTRSLKASGAFLPTEIQDKVRHLTQEIQETADKYLDNIRNDENTLELDADAIRGVPDDYISSHPADSATGRITLRHKAGDLMPILEYCQVQTTREKVFLFRNSAASPTNESVLKRLLELRAQKAQLLGYDNWAEYQLENTMVKSIANVNSFLEDAHDAIRPRAEREKLQIAELLKENDGVDVQLWDLWYGETLLKSHLLKGFDLKATRNFFQVRKVFPALLQMAETLFGLRFVKIDNIEAWHPSVTASKVYDISDGKESLIGRLFFDLYPRDGKLDGAAAYTARAPIPEKQLAEMILYANMPAHPTACMSYRNVQTLLHELGHCIHGLVAKHRYADFAGLGGSEMDFLEVPSQMLELFLTDYKLFDFATNEKGELIAEHMLKQLITADRIGTRSLTRQVVLAKYAVSYRLLRQTQGYKADNPSTSQLDLHTTAIHQENGVFHIVAAAHDKYDTSSVASREHSIHLSFWHLAMAPYASRYYSYLFAEVICHDLFQEFQKGGNIMDVAVAQRYRKLILEQVGSRDADDAITEFLGRKYSSKAYKEWLSSTI